MKNYDEFLCYLFVQVKINVTQRRTSVTRYVFSTEEITDVNVELVTYAVFSTKRVMVRSTIYVSANNKEPHNSQFPGIYLMIHES